MKEMIKIGSLAKKIEKNKYKTLYETELHNRKMYEKRYKEVIQENIELQKSTGIAELRKEIAKLKLELEDTQGFLAQERQAKEELLKEREEKNEENN